jgi:aryl-alcohol dehydrogenase-like predicted oxidoreductase
MTLQVADSTRLRPRGVTVAADAVQALLAKRMLGRTGMMVSEMGLGTWALGGLGGHADAKNYGPVEECDAMAAFEEYVAAGGNFIDCAENYHDCESRLGKFIRQSRNRDKLVLCSKVWQTDESTVCRKLDKSRRLLGVDSIDVYYLHNPPDDYDQMHRTLDLYLRLKDEGKIRAIGATIKGHNVSDETVRLMDQYIESGKLDVIMCIFSVLRQKTGQAFARAQTAGVAIVLRTVLESGFLTGKYRRGHTFNAPQDHRQRWSRQKLDQILELVERFTAMAVTPPYQTSTQVAARFALDTPHISSVLLGARNADQVRQNLSVLQAPPLPASLRQEIVRQFGNNEKIVSLDL